MIKLKIIFPLIIFVTFLASLLESYSYIGFLSKYILVDSRVLIALSLSFLLVWKGNIGMWLFSLNKVLLPIFIIIYITMQVLEASKFHNYIFSTYHIRPENFIYIVLFSLSIYILGNLKNIKVNLSLTNLCMSFLISYTLISNLAITLNQAVYTDLYISFHPTQTYEQKMNNYWGFFYDYISFVKENTNENSTIIIPPQESPWLSTGNGALVRYFLYPRIIIQGTFDENLDSNSADYVMIAWGEWEGAGQEKYGWPKVKVPSEKVIYLNTSTKDWGLIKIKK